MIGVVGWVVEWVIEWVIEWVVSLVSPVSPVWAAGQGDNTHRTHSLMMQMLCPASASGLPAKRRNHDLTLRKALKRGQMETTWSEGDAPNPPSSYWIEEGGEYPDISALN